MFKIVIFKIIYYLVFFLIFVFSILLFLKMMGNEFYYGYIGPYIENALPFLFR